MIIRLLSDIHIELAKDNINYIENFIPKNKKENEILVLAGDIGDPNSDIYKIFLEKISKYYDEIIIITGNHEYYNNNNLSLQDIDYQIYKLSKEINNVHFLQNNVYIYNRIRFLGCTLWTESDYFLAHTMRDYSCIPDMTSDKCNDLFRKHSSWLSLQLSKENNDEYDKTVVITHHLPSYSLVSKEYINNPLNIFYANNIDSMVRKADIWLCGHSHKSKITTIGKCKCYLNPWGYEHETSNYDNNLAITL